MKKTSILISLFLFISLSIIVLAAGTPVLLDHFDTNGEAYNIIDNYTIGVAFNATDNYSVIYFDVYIKRVNTDGSQHYFFPSIREKNGDNWTDGGTVLGTDSHNWNDLSTNYIWLRTHPTTSVNLTAGEEYLLTIIFPAGDWPEGEPQISWTADATATPTTAFYSNEINYPGNNWTYYGGRDLYFRIYGSTDPVYKVIDPDTADITWAISENDSDEGYYWYCDTETLKKYYWIDGVWIWVGSCGISSEDIPGVLGDTILIKDTIDESIGDVMTIWGLNNPTGGWIMTLALMCLAYYLGRKNKFLLVCLEVVVFGIAISLGWVAPWVLLLLAVVFGVIVWQFLQGKQKNV